VTRYPALVMAVSWCVALAAAVVLVPAQALLGAIAVAAAVPMMALAPLLRPALVAMAIAVALLAVGRSELPPIDPQVPLRAASLAGATVVMVGRVVDDARSIGGGGEVLVEPSEMRDTASHLDGIGNLMVRWRGPTVVTFGDSVRASGKLALPRDMPGFDRRAYMSQRRVFLELRASSFEVTAGEKGVAGIPAWLRSRYTATLNSALPPPHAAVLLGIVLGIRQGIPAQLQQALPAIGPLRKALFSYCQYSSRLSLIHI